jgi:hypothetical protein
MWQSLSSLTAQAQALRTQAANVLQESAHALALDETLVGCGGLSKPGRAAYQGYGLGGPT